VARGAFDAAATSFLRTVEVVPEGTWEEPGLGEWTRRELVGHALRAFMTIEQYLDPTRELDEPMDAVEYFRRGLSGDGVHEAIAERGRAMGRALGDDPIATVRETVARVVPLVDGSPDDVICLTSAGPMRLIDYLPTRVVELVVHTLDLTDSLGLPPDLDPHAAQLVVDILAGLADRGGQADVIRALSGRSPLPHGFTVLG
jgi:uncharacterized protein (TIGR03083 family)